MISPNGTESPVYSLRYSSVVPAQVTGDLVHELTNMDLAMKLHYIRGVYLFKRNAVEGLTIHNFKEPMFHLLELYYPVSGRIRKTETGRPFVRCNDGGVRIIEARCDMTVDEWLEMDDPGLTRSLVSGQVLGSDLAYSPLVLIQFTAFKCGGISVGLSWAHVLGDAFSASKFINLWSQILAGTRVPKALNLSIPITEDPKIPVPITANPLSLKHVKHAGDHWKNTNNREMGSFTFQISAKQLSHLYSNEEVPTFEALSSLIWQSVAKVREGSEPKIVTIIRNDTSGKNSALGNNQTVSVVNVELSVMEADPSQLAELIAKFAEDEKSKIDETIEKNEGVSDFILYGGSLTFVDMQDAEVYNLEINGYKPVFVNYAIDGVGDEGVVIVLPGPEKAENGDSTGRTVRVIVPENEVSALKCALRKNGVMPEDIVND